MEYRNYIARLKEIRAKLPVSEVAFAKMIGIDFKTLKRVCDPNHNKRINFVTVRKILSFVEKQEKKLKDNHE